MIALLFINIEYSNSTGQKTGNEICLFLLQSLFDSKLHDHQFHSVPYAGTYYPYDVYPKEANQIFLLNTLTQMFIFYSSK